MPTSSLDTVVVLGSDGYIGWPLTCRLLDHGVDVVGVDDRSGREYRGESVVPIRAHSERLEAANEAFEGHYEWWDVDVTSEQLETVLRRYEYDGVVNLAQIPSAPYSMQSYEKAWRVQENNVKGSLNLYWTLRDLDSDAHVVQLATMGEYGCPEYPIPEGFREDGRPASKEPGSLYHASKVQTTVNSLFLSNTWNIPTTEIYQGIVYGAMTDATQGNSLLNTRFDVDETFGTVVNRFTAQATVDHPLTVYGRGGQKRAMLSLQDSVRCIHLLLENPPEGDRYPYRAVNQFHESHRVRDLANMVHEYTGTPITHVENPRVEDDDTHYYEPERNVLPELGYTPACSIEAAFEETLETLIEHRDLIDPGVLRPSTEWR